MSISKPGRPVRGARTGRPMTALLDLLGRRWALRALWELRLGALTFRALRDACDAVSPSVLAEDDGDRPSTTSLQLSANVGYVPANVHASTVVVTAAGPVSGGEDTALPMSSVSLGAQATLLFPYYGPGLPRAMLLAG